MRMKAKVIDTILLTKMLQSVEKLSKTCIMKFTEDKIYIIIAKIELTELQVWGQVASNLLLEEFTIESANNNEIWIEVRTDHVIRVLKSAQTSIDIHCKLSKKKELSSLSFNIKRMVSQNLSQQEKSKKEQFSECQISIIDFENFVHNYIINPSNIICSIIENFAVIFYVYVKNESTPLMDYDQETRQFGTLTFYIPAII
ncbi:Hus1-like protein-domain-containing protein, partial [Neocallimastix sp. 'constans']